MKTAKMRLEAIDGTVKWFPMMDKDGEPVLNKFGKQVFVKIGVEIELNSGSKVFYTFPKTSKKTGLTRGDTYTMHHSNGTTISLGSEINLRRKYSPAMWQAIQDGMLIAAMKTER